MLKEELEDNNLRLRIMLDNSTEECIQQFSKDKSVEDELRIINQRGENVYYLPWKENAGLYIDIPVFTLNTTFS